MIDPRIALRSSLMACAFMLSTCAWAQSEEKTFKSSTPQKDRADACLSAKEQAQAWLKENTDRSHAYYLMLQAKRGWPAKSEGTSSCECSATDGRYSCTVDAKISRVN